jgi:hypothetical protein
MWIKCDYKENNFKGTKNLEYVEQIRIQGEQIISVLKQNQDFKRNNILAPMEQIMTTRENKSKQKAIHMGTKVNFTGNKNKHQGIK